MVSLWIISVHSLVVCGDRQSHPQQTEAKRIDRVLINMVVTLSPTEAFSKGLFVVAFRESEFSCVRMASGRGNW